MLQSQQTCLVLAPRQGPCPPGLTCLQTKDRPQSPGGQGSWRGRGGQRALWVSVDERKRGSPGSPSETSLSLPGPTANLSLRWARPFP